MTDHKQLADLLFPHINTSLAELERRYPPRDLPPGAKVTRIGPSPTGFVHLGNLYNAIIGERLAHQSGGVFYLRVEDTDAKREVEGAISALQQAMDAFGVRFDEGLLASGEIGAYGPYSQRQRKDIYQAVAKHLVSQGQAYPCFCTEEELATMREQQQAAKLNFGYYGSYTRCRELTLAQIKAHLAAGHNWVLRFKSEGDPERRIQVEDAIRGTLDMPENEQDFILLKSDGIPTYHFAHVVDDHYMHTTHVVRGEEWLATLPMHVQCFDTLGWPRPLFCHTAQLMKIDETSGAKRKLSKRSDPELGLEYYQAQGYLPQAVWEYLLLVLNSNFEEWRLANPTAPLDDFPFSTEKMSSSGALFDLDKLMAISQELLFRLPADEIRRQLTAWCEQFDPGFAALLARDIAYAEAAIDLGRHDERPRKDLVAWKQAVDFLGFYYDERFQREDEWPLPVAERQELITAYLDVIDLNDDSSQWFHRLRELGESLGYAPQPKLYKKNPELYRGSIVELSNTIRVALTGRAASPDLWQIAQLLGEQRVRGRLTRALED